MTITGTANLGAQIKPIYSKPERPKKTPKKKPKPKK